MPSSPLKRSIAGLGLLAALLCFPLAARTLSGFAAKGTLQIRLIQDPMQGSAVNACGDRLESARLWWGAVSRHEAGKWDSAAVTIWLWEDSKIKCAISEYLKYSDGSMLKRGVLLHTDIALLAPLLPAGSGHASAVLRIADGLPVGISSESHWSFARALLDQVPQTDEMVRQWYVATTAWMQNRQQWGSAYAHLRKARTMFPADALILFCSGIMHEVFASPPVQSYRGSVIRAEKDELQSAREYLQLAVNANPGFAEARLRLGRCLGLLGNHERAAAELLAATGGIKDPQLVYCAALFLGREYEMLGRADDARQQYEKASVLYPAAQSPLFALGEQASRSGDAGKALILINKALALPMDDAARNPLWNYHVTHVLDADALIADIRRIFGGISR